MISSGLVEEVRALWKEGIPRTATSVQGLGYKELYAFFDSETTLAEAVDLIRVRTRHYAKRQLTWFRRDGRITWIPSDRLKDAPEIILRACGESIP